MRNQSSILFPQSEKKKKKKNPGSIWAGRLLKTASKFPSNFEKFPGVSYGLVHFLSVFGHFNPVQDALVYYQTLLPNFERLAERTSAGEDAGSTGGDKHSVGHTGITGFYFCGSPFALGGVL